MEVTEQAVGPQATVILQEVQPGVVNVELRGLAAGCMVQGEHPRGVQVRAQVGTRVDLAVMCGSGA